MTSRGIAGAGRTGIPQTGVRTATLLRFAAAQKLRNVRVNAGAAPLETDGIKTAIAVAEEKLAGSGRLLICVMTEAEDTALVAAVVEEVCEAVRRAA